MSSEFPGIRCAKSAAADIAHVLQLACGLAGRKFTVIGGGGGGTNLRPSPLAPPLADLTRVVMEVVQNHVAQWGAHLRMAFFSDDDA